MLDHLQRPDFDFEKEIEDILKVTNNFGFLISKTPHLLQNVTFSFPFPNKALVSMQLAQPHAIGYLQIPNREWLRSPSALDSCTYSPLIKKEFRDLYFGIAEHYRFVTGLQSDLRLSKASRYLNRAVMDDRRCSAMEMPLSRTSAGFLESFRVASDPNRQKDGLASRRNNETRNQRNIVADEGVSDVSLKQKHITIPGSVLENVFLSPGCAPETKFNIFDAPRPSFAVSASYLANFHYSTRKDYDLANRICVEASTMLGNDSIENSDQNPNDRNQCALILNNKLVVLFDHQIQTVFGFVVLVKGLQSNGCEGMSREAHMSEFSGQQLSCDKNVSQVESRIFCRLRPLDFLNYARYRCELQKYVSNTEQIPDKKHEIPTRPDFSTDSSSVILFAAARITA